MGEQLVLASSIRDGQTVCAHHVGSLSPRMSLGTPDWDASQCRWCRRVPHRAYFIVNQEPLCIRHAADAVFADDDMGAHDMAHAAYLHLNADGVDDAY